MEYKNLPDLKSLSTLVAVVERGGVIEAARVLHVGQPAVTKRLRALENCYGTQLMERKSQRLQLTAAGERVYAFASLVLKHQETLVEDLASMHHGQDFIRLEVTFAIGEHLLPNLLLQFSETYPQFKIHSRMAYSRRIQAHLATDLADLGLLEQAPDHPDILVQKWLDDELLLVCGQLHPLSGSEQISVNDLSNINYVLRERSSSMRIVLDKALRDIGVFEIPVAMEVGSTDTIVEMLERGRHMSFLPRFAVAEALTDGTLCHIRVQGLRIKRTLWIARTRSNLDNEPVEAFINLLRAEGKH